MALRPCRGAQRPPLTKVVVVVDEGTPRVDEVDKLVLHVEKVEYINYVDNPSQPRSKNA